MSILNHRWGLSYEQDAVWSLVAGMDPERADRTLLMIWQGYFDESEKDDWFVIAGFVARVGDWAAFAAEWAPMARKYGRVDRNGKWHFHMAERGRRDDTREDLPALRNIIADHVLMGLSIAIRPSDYWKAVDRLVGFNGDGVIGTVDGHKVENLYLFASEYFLDSFSHKIADGHQELHQINLEQDKVEVIFDERAEKGIIRNAWEDYKRTRQQAGLPNVLSREPRFEDDKVMLPLQAADFLAYWLRERLAGFSDAKTDIQVPAPVFPFMREGDKRIPINVVILDEEDLVAAFEGLQTEDGSRLIDRKKFVSVKIQ